MKASTEGEGEFKPNPILVKILNESGWYKTLVETMPEGIIASDMNGIIVYANPKIHQMIGYADKELIGMDSLSIVVAKDRARVRRESEKRFNEKATSQYEITFKTKVGSKVPVIISGTPILGPNSESIGTYAIITDIRYRKRAQKQKH
ncbi:MAG: PAS domain S-box protein [Candidatus Heimdallarchaeota archaeon]